MYERGALLFGAFGRQCGRRDDLVARHDGSGRRNQPLFTLPRFGTNSELGKFDRRRHSCGNGGWTNAKCLRLWSGCSANDPGGGNLHGHDCRHRHLLGAEGPSVSYKVLVKPSDNIDHSSVISYSISFSNLTWGEDISRHINTHYRYSTQRWYIYKCIRGDF
jgi:hypothetical protein